MEDTFTITNNDSARCLIVTPPSLGPYILLPGKSLEIDHSPPGAQIETSWTDGLPVGMDEHVLAKLRKRAEFAKLDMDKLAKLLATETAK